VRVLSIDLLLKMWYFDAVFFALFKVIFLDRTNEKQMFLPKKFTQESVVGTPISRPIDFNQTTQLESTSTKNVLCVK